MKKVCSKCKEEKPLELFYKRLLKDGTDVRSSRCKECNAANNRALYKANPIPIRERCQKYNRRRFKYFNSMSLQRYQNAKDGKYHVYLIPEEHYCGQTENPEYRFNSHRHLGKILSGSEIVMSFDNRRDALRLERCFHKLGWLGGKV